MYPLAQASSNDGLRNTIDSLARTPLSQILILGIVCTVIRLAAMGYLSNTPKHLRSGPFTIAKFFSDFADAIVYAGVVVFMLVRPFAVQTFTIPSESMEKTLLVGDFVLLDKFSYRRSDPKFGDIVVFNAPEVAKNPHQPNVFDFIKRLRGEPGDLVEIRGGVFYRNGKAEPEPFVNHYFGGDLNLYDFKLVEYNGRVIPALIDRNYGLANLPTQPYQIPIAPAFAVETEEEARRIAALPAVKVPPGEYLFMGDNRERSFDGRSWGLIKRDAIVGKSIFKWWPPRRWGPTH
jgi:signal peptidase I